MSPLNWPGKFFDKASTRQNVIDTGCEGNENSVFGVRGNIVWYLPRTQTSLFEVRAKEGGKEYPSHGPLRFITSNSRFALASASLLLRCFVFCMVWYCFVFCSCVFFQTYCELLYVILVRACTRPAAPTNSRKISIKHVEYFLLPFGPVEISTIFSFSPAFSTSNTRTSVLSWNKQTKEDWDK